MSEFARYPSLIGRSVFVSGGASGIGASIVEHFVAQGAKTAFVDIDGDAAAALCAKLKGAEHAPLFLNCDLADVDALRAALAETAERHGPVTALVNNAARDTRYDVAEVDVETWDNMQAVNLRHAFFASQAVYDGMKAAGGGAIVNFSSPSFMRRSARLSVYGSAKAALIGLTRTLSRDFGAANIRVNAVVPGWTMTERQKTLWLTPEVERRLLEDQSLKGFVMPEDVARLVLFLSADDSRMMTAQTYIVDAGLV